MRRLHASDPRRSETSVVARCRRCTVGEARRADRRLDIICCMRAMILCLLLLAACSCGPATPDRAANVAAVPIDNFAEVAAGVYRGAQPDAAGFKALRDMGVKTIVNLRSAHDDRGAATPLGLDVVTIPMPTLPDIDPPTAKEIRAFFDVINDAARRPVFIHCAQGKDRTGTMCALYRMEVDGWTADRAVAEMRSFGYHENLYADLEEFVRAYKPAGLAARPPR
jgi:protein tyrosine phosphatase (PTP) superfamily phosphohydrolase (DUF442 family)